MMNVLKAAMRFGTRFCVAMTSDDHLSLAPLVTEFLPSDVLDVEVELGFHPRPAESTRYLCSSFNHQQEIAWLVARRAIKHCHEHVPNL